MDIRKRELLDEWLLLPLTAAHWHKVTIYKAISLLVECTEQGVLVTVLMNTTTDIVLSLTTESVIVKINWEEKVNKLKSELCHESRNHIWKLQGIEELHQCPSHILESDTGSNSMEFFRGSNSIYGSRLGKSFFFTYIYLFSLRIG